MERDDIRAKVQTILRDVVDDEEVAIDDGTVAGDVREWDSTNHVRLIVGIEEEFDIRFETEEISQRTVGDLVDLIKSKLER
jgi:acyl carrier protein